MIVKIEGKARRSGTSRKTGNPYDIGFIYFLAPQRGVEGLASFEKLVDPEEINLDKVLVGQHYELEMDLNGSIVGLHPAKS